jgi:hypothetical protein
VPETEELKMARPIARLRALLPLALIAGAAFAQTPAPPPKQDQSLATAGRIASQPARDVGVSKTTVPPVLQQAIAAPYALTSTGSCAQLARGVAQLTAVLGPDFVAGTQTNENRASMIAQAGGQTIVNSLLPFRGLVREVSGAAPAQRRLNAAIDAGYARRGFLRGMQKARKCRG